VTRRRFSFAIWLQGCFVLAGAANVSALPSPYEIKPTPVASDAMSAATKFAQAQPAPAPQAPATPAADTTASDEPIGNVAILTGSATVTRNKQATPLKPRDDIFLNDLLQTSANSTLGVTFNDATTFNLTANAQITVDSYVYEDGGKQNAALFDIVKGTVAFAAVAKTGDMKISTPTATLGIRGTTGLVEVPEGAAANSPNNVAIKLYPDADGRVGRIEVSDRAGARLGSLTQGASGFTIRPGAGGRFAAQPLLISPQQALRDQGIVRQVHAAQSVGRQVVTEQRALRRANPQRQPGPQRQNAPQRQNELQNRPGQNPPGQPRQPGVPNRQELQQQPGVHQAAPGQRPGSQTRPVLKPKPPAAPKAKPPPKKKT
jgi:hypothetical protein